MADRSAAGLSRLLQDTPELPPEATVNEAVRTMISCGVGALAVTSGGQVVGVFTERDLMRRVVGESRDAARTLLRDVMTTPVHTVRESASVEEAATLMRTHHIRHLIVVDQRGELLGMVGLRYLLYDLLGVLENKVEDLHQYIMADGPGG